MTLRLLMLIIYAVLALIGLLFAKKEQQKPKADMYLPVKLLAMSLAMLVAAAVVMQFGVMKGEELAGYVCGAALAVLAAVAFLCWKNQKIRILSQDTFEYTTFLGNTYSFCFSDIEGLKRNKDSMTLLLKNGKVHMESMAVISAELVEKINTALEQKK